MTKPTLERVDFAMFLALWNAQQGFDTPDLHFRIASWLEDNWHAGNRKLLLMVFRSAGKSTLTGLFCAWLLYRNPALRILVLAADSALAGKMVRNVKRLIEAHPLCVGMKPSRADQWANDRFTVVRDTELRDPSMLARGISANLTGSRADIVICDDVEVPITSDSAEKRADLRERLAEIPYVLADSGGLQLYIGTPHSYYSIYADKPRTEIGEDKPFLDGFDRLVIPVTNEDGDSVWPERFSTADLEQTLIQSGPHKYKSQMLLQAINITDGRLDPGLLNFYSDTVDYNDVLRKLFIGKVQMSSASAWWDPAFGSAAGDNSVVAIVFNDGNGHRYLQHVEYIALDARSEEDEANQQCRIVAGLCQRFRLPMIAVEINGIGKFLPGLLRAALDKANVPTRVIERTSRKSKDIRILEAFDAPLAARRLHAHTSVQKTPFMTEMQEWQPARNKGHDDGLDAVAGALSLEPMRVSGYAARGSVGWTRRGDAQKAKTEWRI